MNQMNINNLGAATAIGAGIGTAVFSATGESFWIAIGAVVGALFSFIKKQNRPQKARVKIRFKK